MKLFISNYKFGLFSVGLFSLVLVINPHTALAQSENSEEAASTSETQPTNCRAVQKENKNNKVLLEHLERNFERCRRRLLSNDERLWYAKKLEEAEKKMARSVKLLKQALEN